MHINPETPTRKQLILNELKERSIHVAILFVASLLFVGLAFLVLRESKTNDNGISEPYGQLNGYKYVDLGLSVKWAELSIGADAENLAGDLYAWGEIETKEEFSPDNYNAPNEKIRSIERKRHHDVATASYGRGWRMPKYDEVVELVERCQWTPIISEEFCGYKVTGPNGNSIFIASTDESQPAVAIWSSYVTEDRDMAYAIQQNDSVSGVVTMPKYMGLQVRGVTR
jgi:hypothetical protein